MKQIIILLSLIFLNINLFAQVKSIQEIENDLHQSYKQVLFDRFNTDTISWEKLEMDNNIFSKKIYNYTSNYKATLTHNFDSLRKENIDIISSDDNLFRIYSWDTWLGGTMHSFENIFQFKSGEMIYSIVKQDTSTLSDDDYVPYYSQIFSLKANNKTNYLAVNNGIYSSKYASQSIKAFTIENNSLNDTIKLFKTKTDLLNEIDVNYDFFTVAGRPERSLQLIRYDHLKNIIYIPIVLENGKVTDRFILYQFKGKYFEHILTQKKNWKRKL